MCHDQIQQFLLRCHGASVACGLQICLISHAYILWRCQWKARGQHGPLKCFCAAGPVHNIEHLSKQKIPLTTVMSSLPPGWFSISFNTITGGDISIVLQNWQRTLWKYIIRDVLCILSLVSWQGWSIIWPDVWHSYSSWGVALSENSPSGLLFVPSPSSVFVSYITEILLLIVYFCDYLLIHEVPENVSASCLLTIKKVKSGMVLLSHLNKTAHLSS